MKSPHQHFWDARLFGEPHAAGGEEEQAIATEARASYYYANEVLKGKFKLGEKAMSTDPYFAFKYSKHVLKHRFKIDEELILNSKRAGDYISEHRTEFTDEELVMIKMKYGV